MLGLHGREGSRSSTKWTRPRASTSIESCSTSSHQAGPHRTGARRHRADRMNTGQVVSLAPTLDLADQSERDFRTAAQIATASREHAAASSNRS